MDLLRRFPVLCPSGDRGTDSHSVPRTSVLCKYRGRPLSAVHYILHVPRSRSHRRPALTAPHQMSPPCRLPAEIPSPCPLLPHRAAPHSTSYRTQCQGAPPPERCKASVLLFLPDSSVQPGLLPFPCIYSFFPLISAHAFCACRVCVKCAQTQISRLKNFIFQSFLPFPICFMRTDSLSDTSCPWAD